MASRSKAAGSITCPTPLGDAAIGPLPVKIRKPDGEMIGSGVSGGPISVPPGRYFVSIIMPDGRERAAGGMIKVQTGLDSMLAPLTIAAAAPPMAALVAEPQPASAGADVDEMFDLAFEATRSRGMEMAAAADEPAEPNCTVQLWRGDWFASWDRSAPVGANTLPDLRQGLGRTLKLFATTPTIIDHDPGADQLLVLKLAGATRYSVVPYDECTACIGEMPNPQQILARLVPGPVPSVQFRSSVAEEANSLLSFVENGVLTEMRTVSEDMVNQGERALYGSGGSSLRAVTGAYVLLRSNHLDGLNDWLIGLERAAPLLPDIAILRAEMLARLGMHQEALALLKTAIDGRCPWFRGGLSYMFERVRLYIEVSANKAVPFAIADDALPGFIQARDRLDRLMRLMVRGEVISTFDVPD